MDYNNARDINLRTVSPRLKSIRTKMSGNHLRNVKSKITSMQLLRTSLSYQTKEFFNNSTLHGVRYIAESDRPFGERFMWFCFTMIGFISALVIIFSLWEKYQTNPTITGLDMDVHNQQLVFPTIVVCPHESYDSNRTHEVALMDLGNYNESYVDIFEPFLKQLTQLTFETMNEALESSKKITVDSNYVKIFKRTSLRTLMFKANVFCTDIFETCTYRDETIDCCDHFHQMYTEHGFCFGFNARYFDTSDAEQENKNFLELFETDKKWALHAALKSSVKVFVHAHQEHFGWDFRPHVFDTENGADLLISLKQTYTTEDAKQLSVSQRKCLFDDEMKLKYFQHEYTFTACSIECRIRNSLKFCGCVPPFYRQIPSKPYCTVMDIKCLARFTLNITNIKSCGNCELTCANTVFDIEKLTKGTIDPSKTSDNYVSVEFLTWPIIRYKREVLFGWVDLLVSFGGIAGLFLGFSLLSGVEIAYYFTMRTFCMLYKNRAELYEIEEEKLSKPPKRINLSLSLIRNTANDSKQEASTVHHVEVNEISSRVEPSNQTEAAFGPNNVLREDYNNGKARISQLHMTRVAKKVAAARAINHLNRLPTSYDFAETNGPYYMP